MFWPNLQLIYSSSKVDFRFSIMLVNELSVSISVYAKFSEVILLHLETKAVMWSSVVKLLLKANFSTFGERFFTNNSRHFPNSWHPEKLTSFRLTQFLTMSRMSWGKKYWLIPIPLEPFKSNVCNVWPFWLQRIWTM